MFVGYTSEDMPKKKNSQNQTDDQAAGANGYHAHRDAMAAVSRERSAEGRDIGLIPAPVDLARRESCRESLRLFCETYLAARFGKAWSPDHLRVIEKLEAAVLLGGLFALAMPRGSGKTTLAEAAALWAIAYGHRRFVVLIGATDDAATEMLDSLKIVVETAEEFGADFPEVCFPVRALEGIHNRAGGQTAGGVRTRIRWTSDEIAFPTVPGAASSGAVIRVAGITGRIRGMKAATATGETIRPDFAIADDPQTDASAASLVEIDKRERRLRGAVKGLAGPGKSIAMVVPCTVICPRDLSDRILDRDRHPQFQGERMRMLYAWPTNLELWERYAELRRDSLRNDRRGEEATEFYLAHRAEMDAGAHVAWPERYDPDAGEVSGLQAAMNLWTDNPAEFAAEYQNDPEPPGGAGSQKELRPAILAARLSGVPRRAIPREATRLTAFVDCGGELLWYAVCAWDSSFGGSVVDYGTWPRQARAVFSASDPRPGLSGLYPGLGEEQRLFAGLRDLTAEVLSRTYARDQVAEELRVERCLIDAGWQSQTVHQFVRSSPFGGLIYPSKGIGRTTTARGVSEWKARPGERVGHHWRLTLSDTGRGRLVQFDPDAWKSFLYDRFTTPDGGRGRLLFFGAEARAHELLAEHCCAEYAEAVTIRGQTFDKWQVKPHRPDNHWLDCLVGCAVAASVAGAVFSPTEAPMPAKKKRLTLEEKYARARGLEGGTTP